MNRLHFIKPILILLAVAPFWCSAQSMALEVIGSSGGTSSSGGYSLCWTLGETSTFSGSQGNDYLGAGFQQARSKNTVVGLFEYFVPSIQIKAFPNPATDYLTVESGAQGLTLCMYDLLGRPMIMDTPLNGQVQLSLSQLPAGVYVLQALNAEKRVVSTVQIHHVKL